MMADVHIPYAILVGLLIIDLILSVYGVIAFRKAQKSCHEMLQQLVARNAAR